MIFFSGHFLLSEVRGRKDKTERGDTVVLLHDGLIMTIWAWSLLHALRFQGNDFDRLMSDTKAAANFFVAVGRFWNSKLELVEIENPIPFELTEHSWDIVTALMDSGLAYIVGHEIGHLLEKHGGYTDDQMENYRMENKGRSMGTPILYPIYLVGVKTSAPEHMARSMPLGPYFGISLIATLRDSPGLRHPSASMRFERLRKEFRSAFKSQMSKDEFLNFRQRMGSNVFKIIDQIGTKLFEQHKAYSRIIAVLVQETRKVISACDEQES